jgi:hypothetical protein
MRRQLRSITWLGWILLLLATVSLACNMQPQPTAIPTPTPAPDFCIDFSAVRPPVERPADPIGYQTTIVEFLNRGGSPSDLESALRQWGVLDDIQGGVVNDDLDLNEDGHLDILVTFHYPSTTTSPQPPGQLLVFGCQGPNQQYGVLYGYASAPQTSQSMPRISFVQDITLDNLPEIVFFVERCTSLACFREPIILTWDRASASFISLSNPFTEMYIYTDDSGNPIAGLPAAGLELQEVGRNQPYNLVIQEGYMPQREAGPHRPARHTWTWHGIQYLHTAVEYDISSYIIHILRDADRQLRINNFEEAIDLYQSVLYRGQTIQLNTGDGNPANDITREYRPLSTWGGIYPKPENHQYEEAMLDNYTRFRLVLAHTALRSPEADTVLNSMLAEVPWQQTYDPTFYTLLASTFRNTFLSASANAANTNALHTACEAVNNTLMTQPSMAIAYEFLGDPDYFGTSLKDYGLADLCPF